MPVYCDSVYDDRLNVGKGHFPGGHGLRSGRGLILHPSVMFHPVLVVINSVLAADARFFLSQYRSGALVVMEAIILNHWLGDAA